MLYFDTSYLARLYLRDAGWEKARALAATDSIACCVHGQGEAVAALHRKFREGAISEKEFRLVVAEFDRDCQAGAVDWLPLSGAVMEHVVQGYWRLPSTVHLRAADAMHLACAAENAFRAIYSNDARLLAGANYFGIRGVNIL